MMTISHTENFSAFRHYRIPNDERKRATREKEKRTMEGRKRKSKKETENTYMYMQYVNINK